MYYSDKLTKNYRNLIEMLGEGRCNYKDTTADLYFYPFFPRKLWMIELDGVNTDSDKGTFTAYLWESGKEIQVIHSIPIKEEINAIYKMVRFFKNVNFSRYDDDGYLKEDVYGKRCKSYKDFCHVCHVLNV